MNTKKGLSPQTAARGKLAASMAIFGTIGLFRRDIPLASGTIAFARGVGGTVFLLLFALLRGEKLSAAAIRRNLPVLLLSGAFIGFNWIFLFEAYNYTTVATATLCYYFAPVFVILLSPLVLHEKLTVKKGICTAVALVGMVLVSGVLQAGFSGNSEIRGVLFGLAAAVLYGSVMLLNQKLHDISAYEKTIMQLACAAIVVLPYVLLREAGSFVMPDAKAAVLLLVVCVVHTGIAYVLYFGSMKDLSAQTVAVFSYIDPVLAVLLSAIVLREEIGMTGYIGALLILGATFTAEVGFRPLLSGKKK